MFGDGSNGALNVTSGTTNLSLDTKYQYTTVNVSGGATLSTADTSGSVLYILATTSIVIDGTIDLFSKLASGQSVSSVTIDGELFTNPSVGNGGAGGNNENGATGGAQSNGFGGGGAGAQYVSGTTPTKGGNGGTGGPTGSGGASRIATGGGTIALSGNNGTGFGGGSGSANTVNAGTATSGAGGNSLGANGGNGTYSGSQFYSAGGGGGAGGSAGKPGVHLVLKSPIITITGTINVSGSDGQFGGDGGLTIQNIGMSGAHGSGGGGGGGGNSGNVYITSNNLTDSSATYTTDRGFGMGGGLGYASGGTGTPGVVGTVSKSLLPADYAGPFVRVWDGSDWQYTKQKVYVSSAFKEAPVRIQ